MYQSKDENFNRVKHFHAIMDERTQESPKIYDLETAIHRSGFKLEEIIEFLHSTAKNQAEFDQAVVAIKAALDQAVNKVSAQPLTAQTLVGQVDALIDLLYFVYGSFVLMGVDPAPIFDIVHGANMGKIFPDGKAHFDPVTHKILKPDDWMDKYAPEPAIRAELEKQIKRQEK